MRTSQSNLVIDYIIADDHFPASGKGSSGISLWRKRGRTGYRLSIADGLLLLDDEQNGLYRVTHLSTGANEQRAFLKCSVVDETTVRVVNPLRPAQTLTLSGGDLVGTLPGDDTYSYVLEAWSDNPADRNRRLLQGLLEQGRVHMKPLSLMDTGGAVRRDGLADRVAGMLYGLAIGDALGNTTEGMSPAKRQGLHGEVRDYLPNSAAQGRAVGLPTDDTQLAFWTIESLLEHDRLDVDALARKFGASRVHGIGRTMEQFLSQHGKGMPWPEAAPRSAGNGALMRIAPILLPHLRSSGDGFTADAVLCAALTHNDPASIASSYAFARMLIDLMEMKTAPTAGWWSETFVKYARPIEGKATSYKPRTGRFQGSYAGPLWRFVEERLGAGAESYPDLLAGEADWSSGSFLLETVPCVLLALMRHAHDPEEAIVRAVNDTIDNDTIASIVGAAVGALHGGEALPRRWKAGLSGRIRSSDNGSVQKLIDESTERWV